MDFQNPSPNQGHSLTFAPQRSSGIGHWELLCIRFGRTGFGIGVQREICGQSRVFGTCMMHFSAMLEPWMACGLRGIRIGVNLKGGTSNLVKCWFWVGHYGARKCWC
jgi:hypothetical protein